jgi:NADP-dependent 3-hydroxy acid dehydrogenase YdfG
MPPPEPSRAVLVTGCSSGIGRATAERLARAGWPVYATARRPETIADLAEAGATVLALDVTDEASMREAVERVEADHGAVGTLVNNAGYSLQGPIEEASASDVRRQFDTNVFGLLRLTQLVLPAMRAHGAGRIVNLSSMGGRFTLPGGGAYHATKYAVEALSDALRQELRAFGVHVILIEPGPVVSNFGDTAIASIPGDDDSGPYAAFSADLARSIESGTSSASRTSGNSTPEQVAAVIERAIRAERPRARYKVGPLGRTLIGLKRVLPDRAFDGLLRRVYTVPQRPPG